MRTGYLVGTSYQTLAVPSSSSIDVPNLTSTSTFTNKRITRRVVTVSDSTSFIPNSDNADIVYQSNSQSAGTLTISSDSGTPTNGQTLLIKIQSTNIQTFSFSSLYVGGNLPLPATSTGGGKIDYIALLYDTVNSKWDYTGGAQGF